MSEPCPTCGQRVVDRDFRVARAKKAAAARWGKIISGPIVQLPPAPVVPRWTLEEQVAHRTGHAAGHECTLCGLIRADLEASRA